MRIKSPPRTKLFPKSTVGQIDVEKSYAAVIIPVSRRVIHNGTMQELNTPEPADVVGRGTDCLNRFGVFHECPHCASPLSPEHAHFRCTTCGWRDSCCD
jgi:hypothetical protein